MHIAINAQLLSTAASYRSAGVSNYSRHLLTGLSQLVAEQSAQGNPFPHRVTAFVNTPGWSLPYIERKVSRGPLHKPLARIAWEQTVLPLRLRQIGANLIHGLVNVLPLTGTVPGVVTVHDLSFLRMPEKFPALKRLYLTGLCWASVQKATRAIAVSRQTAADLSHFFGVDPGKIVVVPNGVDARFAPAALDPDRERQARNLPTRYLLHVGTLEPRKNLTMLVTAFARWRAQAGLAAQTMKLALVGGRGWFYQEIERRVQELGIEDGVIFAGHVPDDELVAWYRHAEGVLFPSLFEGFGLPILEAMACGTPVLCSRTSSFLEVAGDAALVLPAQEVDAWVAGIALLTSQPGLRATLAKRGLARAQHFSWQHTAQATWQVYEACISL